MKNINFIAGVLLGVILGIAVLVRIASDVMAKRYDLVLAHFGGAIVVFAVVWVCRKSY